MNTHCRDSGNQIYLWFSLLIKMGNFLCWNSLLDKIVQVAPLNTKKLTENYFGIHGPHLPWYIMICRHVFIFSMYVLCTLYISHNFMQKLWRKTGTLRLSAKKKPYHLLHIYCTATTTTITVAAMVSISIKMVLSISGIGFYFLWIVS